MKKNRPDIISIILITLTVLTGMFVTWFPLTNSDIWWHLAAGREMAVQKSFLFEDPFSYSMEKPPWIDLHWLFQLLAYAVYSIGGIGALVWTKLVFAGLTIFVMCCIWKKRWYHFGMLIVTAVFLFRIRYLVLMRPIIITMLAMALQIYLLEKFRRDRKSKTVWLLFPVQLIWVNSQGLFILGAGIAGAYWLESLYDFIRKKDAYPLKRLSILLGGIMLCSFVNPWGVKGAFFPFSLFERINPVMQKLYSMNISENIPLMKLSGSDMHYRNTFFILMTWLAAAFLLDRKKTRISHIAVTIGLLYLALCAKRNMLTAVIGTIPFGVYHSVNVLDRLKNKNMLKAAVSGIGIGAVLIIIILQFQITGHYPDNSGMSPFRYPQGAVSWLKKSKAEGNIFQSIRYGGYFIWQMYPQKKVYIDGRLIIRPPDFLAEYLLVCRQPSLFKILEEKHSISTVVLPVYFPDRYRSLIKWLYNSDRWDLTYTDGSSVVFTKGSAKNMKTINLNDYEDVLSIIHNLKGRWRGQPHIQEESLEYLRQLLIILSIDQKIVKKYDELEI